MDGKNQQSTQNQINKQEVKEEEENSSVYFHVEVSQHMEYGASPNKYTSSNMRSSKF